MARETIPFHIIVNDGRIALSGDLDGRAVAQLASVFGDLPSVELLVEADDARVFPDGVGVWIDAVASFLQARRIVYKPSHLAMVLQHDQRYRHSMSSFLDL